MDQYWIGLDGVLFAVYDDQEGAVRMREALLRANNLSPEEIIIVRAASADQARAVVRQWYEELEARRAAAADAADTDGEES